jgi:hypothetical protein
LIDKLCEEASATFTCANLIETAPGYFEYQFTTEDVVSIINATVNGNPLNENEDFYTRAGYDIQQHNVFVNLIFSPTGNITIYYYRALPNGADGFYLGGNFGLDWTDTMYSYGLYYPTSINPTSGGKATLEKNLWFFLETSLLGEADWHWYWEGTIKPRSGYFKIDIYDVVKAAAAYDTYSTGAYDPNYFPGANLDPNDIGHIRIYDAVTITWKYSQILGKPPNT